MTVGIPAFNGTNLATNATTLIRTGPGLLHSVTINTKGASSNTLKIYDGLTASGTLLATIDTTVTFGTLLYDIVFNTGLTVVGATGTSSDSTIAWTAM